MALLDNIIGCWSPSVRGSGYLLPDIAGGGNHCALTNMTASDWTPVTISGVSGETLDFDGVNDVAACAGPSQRLLMTPTTPWTVSAWLNPRVAPSGFPCLVGTWHVSTGVSGWLIGLRPDGTLGFGALGSAGAGGLYSRTSTALAARWQHVVVVYYGESRTANIVGEVYIDGAAVNITAVANGSFATYTSPQFSIGGNYDGNGSNNVQIGEVAVFLGNKTPAEARELYRRGNGGIGRVLTGQTRSRVHGSIASRFRPAWAMRRSQIIGGGLR